MSDSEDCKKKNASGMFECLQVSFCTQSYFLTRVYYTQPVKLWSIYVVAMEAEIEIRIAVTF